MSLIMVDDPDFKGKGPAPQLPRSWAMRKLFKQGVSVGDIGRRYDVSYALAWKSINPPRQAASSPTSKATKPLTKSRLKDMTKTQLEKIAYTKQSAIDKDPALRGRVQAAVDELERRGQLV